MADYNRFFCIFAEKSTIMFIGREKEIKELTNAYKSDEAQFVVVYGRRRVGKTFLVRNTFKGKITFSASGQANGSLKEQLYGWKSSLKDAGLNFNKTPDSWLEAFDMLKELIKQSTDKKKVIFIDEMPWFDTPRSKFVNALEFFWNGWASARDDVLLIVCGSATSWIINKLFKNRGGLHNRVTRRILLRPFNLHECELYMKSKGINLTRYDIIEGYMIMGGIPFYWSFMEKGLSLAQNIDNLILSKSGKLHYEFDELYHSLFRYPEIYINIIKTIAKTQSGMLRNELLKACKLKSNGNISSILEDLEHCGFIRKFPQYNSKKNMIYQLIDNYTFFYLKYILHNQENDESFWLNSYLSSGRKAWVGFAFERVCFQHIPQIKQALGINGVASHICSWRIGKSEEGEPGAQIDMLIDRADNMINICEMKFSAKPYVVSQKDADDLIQKTDRFNNATKNRKNINIILVTPNGLAQTAHWGIIQKTITADDLFKE